MNVTISINRKPKRIIVSADKPNVIQSTSALPLNVTVSLKKGGKGDPGLKGDPGDDVFKVWQRTHPDATLEDFFADITGADGKGAYELWLELGNAGTEADYQIWLKANNTLGDAVARGNTIDRDINANGQKIVGSANGVDGQDLATINQLEAKSVADRAYTDLQVLGAFVGRGDWDASLGTFPPTTSSGAAIKNGFTFNVIVAGWIGDRYFDVGDAFYANTNSPGQIPVRWSKFEIGTDQATEAKRGTLAIAPITEIQNENTLDDLKAITPKKFWSGLSRLKALANTWVLKQTFSIAPRLSSLTAGQWLKVDGNKDVVGVSAIPAADVTESVARSFVTPAQKLLLDSMERYFLYDAVDTPIITGTIAESILRILPFPGGMFKSGSSVEVSEMILRTGSSGAYNIKYMGNTTPTLINAKQIGGFYNVAANRVAATYRRKMSFTGTNIISTVTSSADNYIDTASAMPIIPFDTTADYYIMVVVTLVNTTTDSIKGFESHVKGRR